MRVDHKKKGDGLRVHHERKSDDVRVDHKKKSDKGVELTMRERAMG